MIFCPKISWLETTNIYSQALHSVVGWVLATVDLAQLSGWICFRLQVGWVWRIVSETSLKWWEQPNPWYVFMQRQKLRANGLSEVYLTKSKEEGWGNQHHPLWSQDKAVDVYYHDRWREYWKFCVIYVKS